MGELKKLCPIIMGSEKDLGHAEKMREGLDRFGIGYAFRVASAHKHPDYLRVIVDEYKSVDGTLLVYVTVAGRQDALTNTLTGMTRYPVIGCPPDARADADILSSLHRPSGITSALILNPGDVGLEAAKYMALADRELAAEIERYQAELRREIEEVDRKLRELRG